MSALGSIVEIVGQETRCFRLLGIEFDDSFPSFQIARKRDSAFIARPSRCSELKSELMKKKIVARPLVE